MKLDSRIVLRYTFLFVSFIVLGFCQAKSLSKRDKLFMEGKSCFLGCLAMHEKLFIYKYRLLNTVQKIYFSFYLL